MTIRRRVYHVDGPNSLWHVDGHHKLIRWHMVIHGGIDGYSRTVVFLIGAQITIVPPQSYCIFECCSEAWITRAVTYRPWRGKCRCLAIHGGTACLD